MSAVLKHRFLIHSLHHSLVAVDIARYTLQTGIEVGEEVMVPSVRLGGWETAEQYFLGLGAIGAMIKEASMNLKQHGVAVLTIMGTSDSFGQESE